MVPILGISPFKETARQLSLAWGVYPGKFNQNKHWIRVCLQV